jgi:hypothetical protein
VSGQVTFFTAQTIYAGNVYYEPFLADDGRVGYVVRTNREGDEEQRELFIYLNPSDHTDDGEPNVFVYIGGDNDPGLDAAQHHYVLDLGR